MPGSIGTIERLLMEITEIFKPLRTQLSEGKAVDFFHDIGIPVNDSNITALAASIQSTTDATLSLVVKIKELLDVAEGDDPGAIIDKGRELIQLIRDILNAFIQLKDDINGLSLPGLTPDQVNDIPRRIFNQLLILNFERTEGSIPVLSLFGILEQVEQNVGSVDPDKPPFTLSKFQFKNLFNWLNPAKELDRLYQWGNDAFDGNVLLTKLTDIFSREGFPVFLDTSGAVPVLDLVIAQIYPQLTGTRGLVIKTKNGLQSMEGDINAGFTTLHYTFDFGVPLDTEFMIFPDGKVKFVLPSTSGLTVSGKAALNASIQKSPPAEPYVLIGQGGASRLEFMEANAQASADFAWKPAEKTAEGDFFAELTVKGGKLIIDTTSGDGFLQKILPKVNMNADFDVTLGVSKAGLFFKGSSSLELNIPTHIEIGPVSIVGVTITPALKDEKLKTGVGLDIKAELGPLTGIVRGIGVEVAVSFADDQGGNFGPLQIDLGFKPPTGIGLSLDAGGFKGGGILDFNPDKKEYFGGLELDFKGLFSLKAFGIINTRMPDGSEGFSLLIIITAEFTPVQLGFGFTLNGVGGLVGLNRTTRVEALREGVKTNSIASILFPQDIVANINRIVSDVKQIFPPQQGHFVICPMGKLGWGTPTIITLELGLLLEIPVTGFKILGILKALLPDEDTALLALQVNFLGEIDFENKSISFLASLYDSRILTFTLTGDMAFRVSFGDNPLFILSVGGFHPAFKDAPADLKSMRRLRISLYDTENVRLFIENYFAVTSNTVQFGARAELFAQKGGFNIYGFIGYDVLFQFSPFKFIADFGAQVALRRHSSVIMSIRVSGQLSGPSPWDARGEASVSFFFFSVSVPFHVSWGDPEGAVEKEKADIVSMLENAINDDRNWKAELPANNKLHVSVRKVETEGDSIVVHPFGFLSFSQRITPLTIDIQKFGNKIPRDDTRFTIDPEVGDIRTDAVQELFAPANFFELSDDDKLSKPSFERMKSGFKITGSSALNAPENIINKNVDYEFSYLDRKEKRRYVFPGLFFKSATKFSAASQSPISHLNNRVSVNAPQKVEVIKEKFVVANVSDMSIFSNEITAGTYTEAVQAYNDLLKEKPGLKGQLQVLSEFELNQV